MNLETYSLNGIKWKMWKVGDIILFLWVYDFIDKNRKNTKNGGDKDNNSPHDSGNLDEIERGILVFYKTK